VALPNDVNRSSAIAAAALLSAVGALPANVLPILLGIFAEWRELDTQQIGMLATSLMGGFMLITAALFFRVRKFDWKKATLTFCVVQFLGFILTVALDGYLTLVVLMFFVGLGAGGVFGVSITSLADTRQPDRNLGLAIFAQVIVAAVLVSALPGLVVPAWGPTGALLTLASLTLLAGGFIAFLPRHGISESSDIPEDRLPSDAIGPVAGLVGVVLLNVGIFGIWSFLERIGVNAGLSPPFVGNVISVALVVGALAALVPVVFGDRLGRRGPIFCASLTLVFAIIVLSSEMSAFNFVVAVICFNFAWTISVIFQLGAVAMADSTGRYVAGIPIALALGGTLGPTVGGVMQEKLGVAGLGGVAVLAVLASAAIAWWVAGNSVCQAVAIDQA
jgi:predicted MFS family arabinose efflux permease